MPKFKKTGSFGLTVRVRRVILSGVREMAGRLMCFLSWSIHFKELTKKHFDYKIQIFLSSEVLYHVSGEPMFAVLLKITVFFMGSYDLSCFSCL
jgi:hypothetical protein